MSILKDQKEISLKVNDHKLGKMSKDKVDQLHVQGQVTNYSEKVLRI